MKKTALIFLAMALTTFTGCNTDEDVVAQPEEPKLSEQEAADITFSREQENYLEMCICMGTLNTEIQFN